MAASNSQPISHLLKNKTNDEETEGEGTKKQSREEWRKAKELEEARKAGTAPAEVDEEGRDINPHIPEYISSAPWYFGSAGATLKHQRPQPEKEQNFTRLTNHYQRGLKGQLAGKFRKGACENCGAIGHIKKDCLERPRKVSAKFSGKVIAADDVMLPDLNLSFDGKRDRWNGYDPSEYQAVVDEHQKLEDYKRQLKAQRLKAGHDMNEEDEDDDSDDEDKYADNIDMPGTKVDSKQRITVRNLRIREDTAKYLRNLDIGSAHYDPKTRSMRDNPYKNTGKADEDVDFAGENFVRFTGDTAEHAKVQMFAWEASDKGLDVSVMAEPTKIEMLKKKYETSKETFKDTISNNLLDKYGGKEHLDVPPRELLLAQTENYVEYSRHGKIVKGAEKEVIRSKYPEDVMINNHKLVWGSYWCSGQWGYGCCHSFIKNSYCTGEAGKTSKDETNLIIAGDPVSLNEERGAQEKTTTEPREESSEDDEEEEKEEGIESEAPKSLVELHQEQLLKKKTKKKKKDKKRKHKKKEKHRKKTKRRRTSGSSEDSDSSDSDSEEDEAKKEEKRKNKLREALIRAHREENMADEIKDDRKRNYNSMFNAKAPTVEDIEAFHLRKKHEDDPMASFMSGGK